MYTQIQTLFEQIEIVINQIVCVLISAQTELALFFAAFAMHYFLFGNVWPRQKSSKKGKSAAAKPSPASHRRGVEDFVRAGPDDYDAAVSLDGNDVAQARAAYHCGDHRAMLRIWNGLRRKGGGGTDITPAVPAELLAQILESMQRLKKDSRTILSEVQGYLKRNKDVVDVSYVNDVLEPLARSLDADVVRGIIDFLPSLDIKADGATYELLMQMFFATRNFAEVMVISEQMRREGIPPTPRVSLVMLKVSVQTGKLDEAVKRYQEVVTAGSGRAMVSSAPTHIATQLVELACREHRVDVAIKELEAGTMPLNSEMLNCLLPECEAAHDNNLRHRLQRLISSQSVKKSGRTYSLLIRSAAGDRQRIMNLLDEMSADGVVACASEVVPAVLATCAANKDIALADKLRVLLQADHVGQAPALLQLIRFYADAGCSQKVCEIYDWLVRGSSGGEGKRRTLIDTRTEKCVIAAALQCGRQDLATALFDASPADIAKHISMIRACASRGNLDEAMRTFEALKDSGAEMTHSLWNTALDACVECSDLRRAGQLMKQMDSAGVVDVVSYNTLIKAHLRQEQYDRAWAIVEEMKKAGHPANHVTFNELVNALVRSNKEYRRAQVWSAVDEMKLCGATPNRITCSILLKSLKKTSPHADVMRTLELIDAMEEPMDEVLLSSVVEACVRVNKPALLAQRLAKLKESNAITITGAHTFGSLIKAHGYAKDIDGAWRCWKEMRSQHVKPTSITIGCMVEAVVSNGDCDGGYELVNTLLEDETCREQVNAIVFGSVLKGYSRSKCTERVWSVWSDMLTRGIEPSVATFNAVVDACARSAQMDRVPALVKDMQARGLTPNLITYSTIMKGYCQRGDMPAAFVALEELRRSGLSGCKPDEVVYNTLLDGCAQAGLALEGERLLREMQSDSVQPSNYTLTVMVKLCGQGRRVDRAFEIVDSITSKYRFRANSHVCAALVQACLSANDTARATTTFERAARDRIQIDARICQNLLRAHFSAGATSKAVSLFRVMLGLNGETPLLYAGERNSKSYDFSPNGPTFDDSFFGEVFTALLVSVKDSSLAPQLLSDLRAARPRMRLDPSIERKVQHLSIGSVS